jgi:hypothetical protein
VRERQNSFFQLGFDDGLVFGADEPRRQLGGTFTTTLLTTFAL